MITRAIELDDDRSVYSRRPMDPVPDVVAELAKSVRALYCSNVRMTGMPRYARYGAEKKKKPPGDDVIKTGPNRGMTGWVALARKLIQIGAPADLYILAQFNLFNRTRAVPEMHFPSVHMLCGYWGEENWRAYSRDRLSQLQRQMESDQVQLRYSIQPIVVNLHWSLREATEYALRDHIGCVITPLTRYCMAFRNGIQTVADETFCQAVCQYVFEQSYYDQILGSDIPDPLREETARVRRNMGL